MDNQPRNEHALELALNRLAGSNIKAVEYRDVMAGVILGQMLPDGCVVKGGTSMRLRLGPKNSRATMDFDTSRRDDLDLYLRQLRERTERGWCDFTGEVLIRKQVHPRAFPLNMSCSLLMSNWRIGTNPGVPYDSKSPTTNLAMLTNLKAASFHMKSLTFSNHWAFPLRRQSR